MLPEDLADEIRDAVVFLAGDPTYLTMAEYGETACRTYLDHLRKKYVGGKPFPKRTRRPKTGRPIGT